MAFIVSLITDKMIEDLEDALKMQGVAKAQVVRDGPLQEDPQKNVTSCVILENDPEDLNGWVHEQVPYEFELSGSGMYKRRFTVRISAYLTRQGLDRAEAKEMFEDLHGRCIHALRGSTRVPGVVDEYGEVALMCVNGVEKSRCIVRGGPPTSWIGDIKVWFTVLTQLS